MKKFLIVSTLVFILMMLAVTNLNKTKEHHLNVPFKVQNQMIFQENENTSREFILKGINLSAAIFGAFPSEDKVDVDTYLEWLTLIQELGVNTIRVSDLMPQSFYKAFKQFNESLEEPIYLLQGIYYDEKMLNAGYDPQQTSLIKDFKQYIKLVIDATHGKLNFNQSKDLARIYKDDISPYVLGYTVGMEWAMDDILFSQIMNEAVPFKGEYFETDETATSFESFLASMADYLMTYEVKSYKTQKLVTFIGGNLDRLLYQSDEVLAIDPTAVVNERQKPFIDIENIKTNSALLSGMFATYNIYPTFSPQLSFEYLEDTMVQLQEKHKIPVVIGEYGIPSYSVKTIGPDAQHLNETLQGQLLKHTYELIKKNEFAGSFLSDWQDRPDRSAWNTKESIILDRSPFWSHLLTDTQSLGLLANIPGTTPIYLDDQLSEWSIKDKISENDIMSLSVNSDEESLYFLVQVKELDKIKDYQVYLDLDLTPKSGAMTYPEANLKFEVPVDFIVKLSEEENRVLVQKYYHTNRFLTNRKTLQIRPDQQELTKDMNEFEPILLDVQAKAFQPATQSFLEKKAEEAGLLLSGSTNPLHADFNSAAGVFKGDQYFEIRIPWGLLNFSDPSSKQIHNDYYEVFKIDSIPLEDIKIGVTLKSNENIISRLETTTYDYTPWMTPKFTQRLKQSYEIMKEAFLSD